MKGADLPPPIFLHEHLGPDHFRLLCARTARLTLHDVAIGQHRHLTEKLEDEILVVGCLHAIFASRPVSGDTCVKLARARLLMLKWDP